MRPHLSFSGELGFVSRSTMLRARSALELEARDGRYVGAALTPPELAERGLVICVEARRPSPGSADEEATAWGGACELLEHLVRYASSGEVVARRERVGAAPEVRTFTASGELATPAHRPAPRGRH